MSNNVLEYCILNIVTHPHSPKQYIDIFKKAFRAGNTANLGSNHSAVILTVAPSQNPHKWKTNPIEGEICRFLDVDPNGDWLNIQTRKMAKDKETSEIKIPENLKPNAQRLSFYFYPDKHLLFVETRDRKNRMSPNTVKKAFEKILNHSNITKTYNKVTVTLEPEHDKVEEAINMPSLQKLTYRLTRPNPDDLDLKEAEVLNQYNIQGINQVTKTIVSQDGRRLELDEDRTLARIAARNGYVKAKGTDAVGRKVTIDTKEHPMVQKETYNANLSTSFQTMVATIPKVLAKLFKMK